jgi:hypothetical protein
LASDSAGCRPEQLINGPSGQVIDRIKGDASGNAVGTAALDFEHKLTATTKLVDKLLLETGSDNEETGCFDSAATVAPQASERQLNN